MPTEPSSLMIESQRVGESAPMDESALAISRLKPSHCKKGGYLSGSMWKGVARQPMLNFLIIFESTLAEMAAAAPNCRSVPIVINLPQSSR